MNTPATHSAPVPAAALAFWPRFLMFPLLAIVLYPPFVMGVGGEHWAVRAAWVAMLTYCWFCVGGSFHEAAHGTLFRSAALNRLTGTVIGMLIGIPFTVYQETHRRHHSCLNTRGDYELWPYSDPETSLWFRRVFVWIDLLFGVVTAPWIYGRIYFARDQRLSAAVRRRIAFEYLLQTLWFAGILLAVIAVFQSRGLSAADFDPVWLLPLLLSPVANTARKFVEHLGLNSTDPLLGTRTIAGGSAVSRLFRYFNFDIAVHGPHHRYPKAQHSELEPRLALYLRQHPDQSIPVFPGYLQAVVDVTPCLWRNPSTGQGASAAAVPDESPSDHATVW